jgi:hypothetical protein
MVIHLSDGLTSYPKLRERFRLLGGICTATRATWERGQARASVERYVAGFAPAKLVALIAELEALHELATTDEQLAIFVSEVFEVDTVVMVDGMTTGDWIRWIDQHARHHAGLSARREARQAARRRAQAA